MKDESQGKSQIILTHTSRIGEDYLKSLDFRYNGNYDKLPHYLILKTGEIKKILDESKSSNFFDLKKINDNSIIISLENLGWLNKIPNSNKFSNWIGNKVEKVKEKRWRLKSYWDLYTEEQTESLIKLCNEVCERHQIEKKFIGNNTLISGAENFKGIITRSNLKEDYTDLSPSFNFVYLLERFNYE